MPIAKYKLDNGKIVYTKFLLASSVEKENTDLDCNAMNPYVYKELHTSTPKSKNPSTLQKPDCSSIMKTPEKSSLTSIETTPKKTPKSSPVVSPFQTRNIVPSIKFQLFEENNDKMKNEKPARILPQKKLKTADVLLTLLPDAKDQISEYQRFKEKIKAGESSYKENFEKFKLMIEVQLQSLYLDIQAKVRASEKINFINSQSASITDNSLTILYNKLSLLRKLEVHFSLIRPN